MRQGKALLYIMDLIHAMPGGSMRFEKETQHTPTTSQSHLYSVVKSMLLQLTPVGV